MSNHQSTVSFQNRADAGKSLVGSLTSVLRDNENALVLALPRGGVPVAFEIARHFKLPLDILIVRKLGAPWNPELAIGAIASNGVKVLNNDIIRQLNISEEDIENILEKETLEIARREKLYRPEGGGISVKGRTVILVDDGIATGATMRAGVAAIEKQNPSRLVVAVPTSSSDARHSLETKVDKFVCLATPEPYIAVGCWYSDFHQISDDEVRRLLQHAKVFPVSYG